MTVRVKAALAGILILCAGTVRAQDAKYISLENGTTYALSPSQELPPRSAASATSTGSATPASSSLKARVTVRPEPNTNLNELEVSIADAIVSGAHDPTLLACINAAKEFDHVGAPAIVFVVTCAHRRPDDYDVTLAVRKASASASAGAEKQSDRRTLAATQSHTLNSAVQKLVLRLTRPVPVLRAIASQSITQIVTWRNVAPSFAPSSLLVSETSNRTLPITFTAHQVDAARIDGEIVKGTLEFTSGETDANGHAALPIKISEPFPLGKAKTTIELRSSDLALPVYVTYDVTTKLHGACLFAAILVGLMLGFFTRTVLKTATERGAARIAGLDLMDRMRMASERWNEFTYRTTIESLIITLDQALAAADATALKETVTQADNAFAIASTELQQRIATLLGSIETTAVMTNSSMHFPGGITDALTMATRALAAARMQVVRGDVDAGRTALDAATATMGQAIEDATAKWRTRLQGALATISSLPPLPPQLQPVLKSTLAALTDQISRLPAASRTPNVATILDAVHAIRFIAEHDLVQRVLGPLTTMAAQIVVVLRDIGADATTIEATRTALLAAVTADVDLTLEGPVKATSDLVQALQKELSAAAAATDVDIAPEFAAGAYLNAANKVANASTVTSNLQPLRKEPADTIAPAASIVPPVLLRAHPIPTMTVPIPEPLRLARARTFREIVTANVMQFAIASVGIAVVGLLALLPAFDGTWRGIVAALFWGYAGDISIDALTDAAKRVK